MTPGATEEAYEELRRAESALRATSALVELGMTEDATSRMYYAAFHAARAALTIRALHAKTHSGLITLFERTFGAEPILGQLLQLRARADYERQGLSISTDDFETVLRATRTFVDRCRSIVERAQAEGPDEPDPPADI